MAAVNHSPRFSPLPSTSPSIFDGFTGVLLVQERSDVFTRKYSSSPASPTCLAVPYFSPDSDNQTPARRSTGISRLAEYSSSEKTPESLFLRREATGSVSTQSGGLRMRKMAMDGGELEVAKVASRPRAEKIAVVKAETPSPPSMKVEVQAEKARSPKSPAESDVMKAILTRKSLKELHQL